MTRLLWLSYLANDRTRITLSRLQAALKNWNASSVVAAFNWCEIAFSVEALVSDFAGRNRFAMLTDSEWKPRALWLRADTNKEMSGRTNVARPFVCLMICKENVPDWSSCQCCCKYFITLAFEINRGDVAFIHSRVFVLQTSGLSTVR